MSVLGTHHLFFDIKARGSNVYVDPGFLAAIREWTPRFP